MNSNSNPTLPETPIPLPPLSPAKLPNLFKKATYIAAPLGLLLLATLWAIPAFAQEPDQEPAQTRINLIIAGNTDGDFAAVDCRTPANTQHLWAHQSAYFHTLDALTDAGQLPRPIALHTGDALFPGALSRFLLEDPDGPQKLAELLAQLPISALALGNREFSIDRGALVDFIDAVQSENIPVQAANLRCDRFGPAEALCAALNDPPFRIVERQGIRFAITSLLADDLLTSLASSQQLGLRILDPLTALPETLAAMNEAADISIVQYHSRSSDPFQSAYEIARSIDGIDLLITSQLVEAAVVNPEDAADNGPMAIVHADQTQTPIISADSGAHSLVDVELVLTTRPASSTFRLRDVHPRRVQTDEFPLHPETTRLLDENIDHLCRTWGMALGNNARLDKPFTFNDMRTFILNVMRFSTRSEIALANRYAFRNQERFPIDGHLTTADVYTTLPFENRLMTAQISGSTLLALADKLDEELVATGLVTDGDKLLVNGRPLATDRLYQIALNDFLAEGGDQIFAPDDLLNLQPFHPHFSNDPPTIEALVTRFVLADQHTREGSLQDAVSAVDNFPNLHLRFLWTFLGSLNASYNQVAVQNPQIAGSPAYDQGQLTVESADQIHLEGRLAAQADNRNHRFNNDLNIQYATSRLADSDRFEETKDLIRLRSSYRYQHLRARFGGLRYIPDPLIEAQVESEFSSPDNRAWHRLDLRGIAGFSFQLFEPLNLRIGANARQDLNRPDARPTWGLNLGYTLRRIDLIRLLGRPIQFESEIEYFYNDIAGDNIHELRSSNRLFFAVFDQFFFTTSFNAFYYRNDLVASPGTNREITIGVNFQWDAALQRF